MADLKGPVILYHANGKLEVCDTQAQVEIAKAKGYIHPRAINVVKFPTTLWAADGVTITVNSPEEKAAKLKEGYSEEFIALAPPKETTTVGQTAPSELSRVLFAEISDLRNAVSALEERVTAVEATATLPPPAKSPKSKHDSE